MNNDRLSDLPAGWEWSTLGEVVEFLDHRRIPVSAKERKRRIAGKSKEELFPYYGANGQVGWIDGYIFDEELVLLAEDGGFFDDPSRAVAYIIKGKTWVNNHAHVLRPLPGIDIHYVAHALNHLNLMPYVSGTTRYKLNQTRARSIPIPVPPEKEQKRIASKVEVLFSENEKARKALRKALHQASLVEQAILAKALRGELVAQNPNDEPASTLLERTKAERSTKHKTTKARRKRQKLIAVEPNLLNYTN